jgi:hypothetical protein
MECGRDGFHKDGLTMHINFIVNKVEKLLVHKRSWLRHIINTSPVLYRRCFNCGIICSFQLLKFPSRTCFLASPTNHR